LVIIGNEILSGKVVDENAPFLIKKLTHQGVQVKWCITIPDDSEIIASTVKEYSEKVDWMFTSGGMGPTPDDLTISSIAKAFGVPLVTNTVIEKAIRDFYKEKCTQAHLKFAKLPEGTLLIPSIHYPQIQFRNIYIFPGVPEFLRVKFEAIEDRFQGTVQICKVIDLEVNEGEIVEVLQKTLEEYPAISLGSYPNFSNKKYRVRLTVEHHDEKFVGEVYDYLRENLKEYLLDGE